MMLRESYVEEMEVLFIVIQMTIELFFSFYFLLNAKKPCCIGDKYHVNEEFVLKENPTFSRHIVLFFHLNYQGSR